MIDSAEMAIAYDGEALKTHSMDVRDLGPALMSWGLAFDEANRVLNGDRAEVKLHVKAHEPGSFEILLEVQQHLPAITHFFAGEEVTAAVNLLELIGGTTGLIWLIKKLRGKQPDKVTDLKTGYIRIEFEGQSFDVLLSLMRLYQDLGVRAAISKALKPLETPGIDSFNIKAKKQVIETVDKDSYAYFKTPSLGDELLKEYEYDTAYSIISLAFKEDNKWRLFDGNSTISAAINDDDFIKKVNNNLISFTKGDILICTVKVTQFKTDSGLKTEYEVLKVKEHKVAARQIPLLFENKKNDDT